MPFLNDLFFFGITQLRVWRRCHFSTYIIKNKVKGINMMCFYKFLTSAIKVITVALQVAVTLKAALEAALQS